jgi:hypothetical protein
MRRWLPRPWPDQSRLLLTASRLRSEEAGMGRVVMCTNQHIVWRNRISTAQVSHFGHIIGFLLGRHEWEGWRASEGWSVHKERKSGGKVRVARQRARERERVKKSTNVGERARERDRPRKRVSNQRRRK